jgi:hypothetical protein
MENVIIKEEIPNLKLLNDDQIFRCTPSIPVLKAYFKNHAILNPPPPSVLALNMFNYPHNFLSTS